MQTAQLPINSPLGDIAIRVVGFDTSDFSIKVMEQDLSLPPGMSITRSIVALIEIEPKLTVLEGRCECIIDQAPVRGDSCSGENLDAIDWDFNGHRLTIGTEDIDALSRRLPQLKFSEDSYPISYHDDGLSVDLPVIPKSCRFSLHFAIAWSRLTNDDDCSTWFAVDLPHESIKSG